MKSFLEDIGASLVDPVGKSKTDEDIKAFALGIVDLLAKANEEKTRLLQKPLSIQPVWENFKNLLLELELDTNVYCNKTKSR